MITTLSPVTKQCKICKREFVQNISSCFNPFSYIPGICSDCNSSILVGLLLKKHCILKYDFIRDIFN